MPASTCCEMAQCQPLCSNDDLISTLMAAASHRYTPTAPSPLNPRSTVEMKPKRHATHPGRSRSSRKRPAETPTEKLLRRKAAIAYQRTTQHSPSPPRQDSDAVVTARPCGPSEKGPSSTFSAKEARPPPGCTKNKPVATEWWEIRHRFLADVEGQPATPLSSHRQGPASRQRLEIFLMLVLLSACLTLLTIVGVDSLKGHYIAG